MISASFQMYCTKISDWTLQLNIIAVISVNIVGGEAKQE